MKLLDCIKLIRIRILLQRTNSSNYYVELLNTSKVAKTEAVAGDEGGD